RSAEAPRARGATALPLACDRRDTRTSATAPSKRLSSRNSHDRRAARASAPRRARPRRPASARAGCRRRSSRRESWALALDAHGRHHDDRAAARDDDGVLVLRRQVAGLADERPAVVGLLYERALRRKKRLDCEHHAFVQHATVARLVVADDGFRLLVQTAADAVPGQVPDDLEAARARDALRGSADRVQTIAGARFLDGGLKRQARREAEAILLGR